MPEKVEVYTSETVEKLKPTVSTFNWFDFNSG